MLPSLRVTLAGDAPLDPAALFPLGVPEIWLEIGFGGGEHLVAQARARPEVGILGAEPFLNGIAMALRAIDAGELHNIRLWPDDARPLLDRLAASSLARIFVLFPDPWPKARHHRRRIVRPDNLARFARALRPDGELRIASDHPDYLDWIAAVLRADKRFALVAQGDLDGPERPDDWIDTRYQIKARAAGRRSWFFRLRKIDGASGAG